MKRLGKGFCFYARATPAVYLYMYRFNFKFYDLVFSFVCLLKRYACLSVYEEIHKICVWVCGWVRVCGTVPHAPLEVEEGRVVKD